MTDEQKESRIKVEDLPQAEQELTPEEAKDVQGGAPNFNGGVYVAAGDVTGDAKANSDRPASKVGIQEGAAGILPYVELNK